MKLASLEVGPNGALLARPSALRIAVLDDEVQFHQLITDIFAELGIETTGFLYKDEFLSQLSSVLPDVIISDIFAPRMDGLQFLRAIKVIPGFRDIPVIIMSGHMAAHAVEAKRLGAFACLAKPCDAKGIISAVRSALSL